jgi:hypothetical protein
MSLLNAFFGLTSVSLQLSMQDLCFTTSAGRLRSSRVFQGAIRLIIIADVYLPAAVEAIEYKQFLTELKPGFKYQYAQTQQLPDIE